MVKKMIENASEKMVFVTGADRGIGLALCQVFLDHGWSVIAGQYMTDWQELTQLQNRYDRLRTVALDVSDPESVRRAAEETGRITDRLDMLVNVAGIIKGDSAEEIRAMFRVNSLGPLCVTQAFLPLLEKGGKRLCYVSSEAGSISLAHRKNAYGYCMSKAALNMSVRLIFNSLRPDGYTFRLYHPGWVNTYMETKEKSTIAPYEAEDTAAVAYRSFTEARASEDVLIMTDINGQTWSF